MSDERLSKFLSLVLRHAPEKGGLTLDRNGWASLDAVVAAVRSKFGASLADIERIVRESDKQRFVIDGGRIRANQGHSVTVDLGLAPAVPPGTLWHGTTAANLASIEAEGLLKRSRQHVHLSPDQDTARIVARRRKGPWVLLTVDTRAMADAGGIFFLSDNGVWLADAVPPHFLTVAERFS